MTCAEWLRARAFAAAVLVGSVGCGAGEQALFVVTGRVCDEAGQPLPGAVVTDGAVSTLTDDAGRYRLAVRHAEITVIKPQYLSGRWTAEAGTQPLRTLVSRPGVPTLAIDGRASSGGLSEVTRTVAAWGGLVPWPGTSLSRLDILLLITPQRWRAEEIRQVGRWVQAGGRLIVCGEWAGYPGLDLATVHALIRPAGITFTGGTLKATTPEAFTFRVPRPAWASLATALGGEPVVLFGAAELGLSAEARPVLVAPQGYVVLSARPAPVLAAVGPCGAGKVFVIGDSSLWRDEASGDDGRSNFSVAGNQRLLRALLGW